MMRIVNDQYRAAVLSREPFCLVTGNPERLRKNASVWKMPVRKADGSEITAYYSLTLSGHGSVPEAGVTEGDLVEKEHIAVDAVTGERVVRGSVFWLQPYWTWRAVSTVLPTNILNDSWELRGEADAGTILAERQNLFKNLLSRITPNFIEYAVVTGKAGSFEAIRNIPMAYIFNERTERTFAIHIESASTELLDAPTYTFRATAVSDMDYSLIAPYNLGRIDDILRIRKARGASA